MSEEVLSGIAIGAVGGAAAGIVLWLVERLNQYEIECRERRRIRAWLDRITAPAGATKWRGTRAIASYCNLPEDRVRYLCSIDKRIVQSSGVNEVWGIAGRARELADASEAPLPVV